MKPVIKVCGMRDPGNISEVAALSPDMMGFIFYSGSPRYCDGLDPEALDCLGPETARVGVFVNEAIGTIRDIAERYGLDHIQLHGDETPEACAELNDHYRIIKAFGIAGGADLHKTAPYEGACDLFIFDTKTLSGGGSGRKFDHTLLKTYAGSTPYLISGGIGPEDSELLAGLDDSRCLGVDINSRFETAPGMKDTGSVGRFINEVRSKTIKP